MPSMHLALALALTPSLHLFLPPACSARCRLDGRCHQILPPLPIRPPPSAHRPLLSPASCHHSHPSSSFPESDITHR
ncbi:hypothetical protein GY45DRAFT_1317695 [Cubamyces sp. BRFM 1775]|nr:hypothetical protein GY45DRAFT_1317695 [Cubamyces sp. BRFM 1775]